jgi:hypothetical protein
MERIAYFCPMSKMIKSYKFFSMDPKEVDREKGNYPIQYVVPFGPEHPSEFEAEEWLKENAEDGRKYVLIPVYTF